MDCSKGLANNPMNLQKFREIRQAASLAEMIGWKARVRFWLAALREPESFRALYAPDPASPLVRLRAERPRIVNFLVAPYLDARWDVQARVRQLSAHCGAMQGKLQKYAFGIGEELFLLDLTAFDMPGFSLVLDKPQWFFREGTITANLFQDDVRLFSVSFSFELVEDRLELVIGSVQGRKIDRVLDIYRDFTKISHGIRPRDFMIEIVRMLARAEGVARIRAIPDRFRHQRHPYFSRQTDRELPLNYDEIWIDRGGSAGADGFFDIPLSVQREFDTIPARKRSLYRKRFALLEQLEAAVVAALGQVAPRPVQSHDDGVD